MFFKTNSWYSNSANSYKYGGCCQELEAILIILKKNFKKMTRSLIEQAEILRMQINLEKTKCMMFGETENIG